MCGAAAGVLMGLQALSGVVQYKAQKQEGRAQEAMYQAQAEQAKQNAIIEQGKSKQIAQQYANQQYELDQKRKLVRGQMAAEMGASGVTGGSGLDMLMSSNRAYQRDSINLLQNQRYETTDSWVKQANLLNQANQYTAAASNTRKQTKMAQLGTIIGTASSMAGTYFKYKK